MSNLKSSSLCEQLVSIHANTQKHEDHYCLRKNWSKRSTIRYRNQELKWNQQYKNNEQIEKQAKNKIHEISIIQCTFSSGPSPGCIPAGCHHCSLHCSVIKSAAFRRTALHTVQGGILKAQINLPTSKFHFTFIQFAFYIVKIENTTCNNSQTCGFPLGISMLFCRSSVSLALHEHSCNLKLLTYLDSTLNAFHKLKALGCTLKS